MKTKKYISLSIVTTLLLVATQIAGAQSFPDPFQKCDEGVHPFIPGSPANATSNDIAHPGESTCFSHLQGGFPSQHKQPVDSVTHLPLKTTERSAPIALHEHHFINTSNSNDGFYKRAWLRKFEITLQPDFKAALKAGTLKCPIPDDGTTFDTGFESCNHTNNSVFGGTKVTFNGTKITYEFGLNQTATNTKPIIPGINPDIDQGVFFPGNTTQAIPGRWFSMAVDFETIDRSSTLDMWSATTTSRAEIIHTAIPKSTFNTIPSAYQNLSACQSNPESCKGKYYSCNDGGAWNSNNSWCNVGGYKWVNIGTDVTVWETVPDEQPPVCDDLTLSINQGGNIYSPSNLTGLEPNQPMTMTVTPTFNPSNESVPLEYRWTGTLNAQSEGFFKDFTSTTQQANPFTDNDTSIYYSGGAAGTSVEVIALDQGTPQSQCQVPFVIPDTPQKPVCVDVTLSPNTLTAPGTNNYTATVQFSDGQTYNTTVEWTGNGTFSNGTSQTGATNSFQNTFNTSATTASVNVGVTGLPPNVDNSPACQQGATVTSTDDGMCVSLTANYPQPVEAGNSIFLDPTVIYSGNLQPSHIQWQETGDGFFFDFVTSTVQPSSFTAPYTSAYIYNAVSQGDSFTLTAIPNPTNNSACTLSETIIEPPDQDEPCDYLNLLPPENGQICINVDPDYNGRYEWTIGNQTFIQNTAECQAFTDDLYYEVEAIDAVNPAICRDELEPKTDDCTYFDFTFPGNKICVDTDYSGPIEWDIDGNIDEVDDSKCFNYNSNRSYEADAVNTSNPLCRAQIEPEEPELEKRARRGGGTTYSMDVLTLRADGNETIDYQLTYKPINNNQRYSTTITDTISKGYIEAILLPSGSGITPGQIDYINGSMRVRVNGDLIDSCTSLPDEAEIEDCYAGDIGNGSVRLVRVRGEALITYRGTVDSALTDEVCKGGKICQEKYLNNAETNNSVVHVSEEDSDNVPEVTSNEIKAQIFCQYILTRAAGDIFLENDLSTGVDISICSKFTTSTGIIITPGDETTPPLVSTGAGDTTIKSIGHEVCTAGQAGTVTNELAELYGSEVSGLSSQICEVKLRTGNPWKQDVITNSIDENKTRVSRWGAEALGNNLAGILLSYQDQNVYHLTGNVTSGNIRMDEVGAKTFIIEDGDLYIDQNIEYTGTCPAGSGQCSVRDVGSLAFIVLNGNIYVEPSVETISGVFFVQEGETAGSGKLLSGSPSNPNQRADEKRLTIYGSVYGDIDPLFQFRFLAGDPSKDEGGIVVRFDQRVILNTPPGLRDILNVSQTEVAR